MAAPRQRKPVVFYRRAAESFDGPLREKIDETGFGVGWVWVGCETEDRADEVRRGFKRAARHLGVAVRTYTRECPGEGRGCQPGGPECRFHVPVTAFDMDSARQYRAARDLAAQDSGRQ